jgi:HAD superfamily hydrolase (TIGR01509 family)
MIKAILMDFNGVIIDDEAVQMKAYQEVLSNEGIDLVETDYYDSLGMDDRTFVVSAYERAGKTVTEEKIAELTAAKLDKWRGVVSAELPLFDGIEEFISKMAGEFSLGIVSMSGRREIEYVLETSGLRRHFSTIVSANDVQKCKPDPEAFRLGFRLLDTARTSTGHLPITHNDCLVIEDSPPGVTGARSADLPVLGVANTVSPDVLRAAGAGAVAHDLRDWMPESIRLVFDKG